MSEMGFALAEKVKIVGRPPALRTYVPTYAYVVETVSFLKAHPDVEFPAN